MVFVDILCKIYVYSAKFISSYLNLPLLMLSDWLQSPKKLNLVAALVRGMRVEDALLQLQVTVKRAAKTVYQVIQSA